MRKRSITSALRISLIYGGLAGLWILLSGKILHWLVRDPVIAANLEIYKGLTFVVVTAMLLYFAIRRQLERGEKELAERKRTQEALTLFRTLIDHSNDGIEVIDPVSGRFLDVNEKECRDLGYTREEMLGMTVLNIDPTQTPETRAKTIAKLQQHGFVTLEGVHRRKDGTRFPVELNIQSIRLDRDYVLTVARDITERKRTGESLALFHALLNQSYDGIEVIDPATGRFLDANQTTCNDLGYTRDELLGMTVLDIDVSMTQDKLTEAVATLRRSGRLMTEGVHRRKDGTTFPVELNKRLVRLDREYIVAVARDISGRKQAELALRESQEWLRLAQAAGRIGIFDVDLARDYATWTEEEEAIYGFAPGTFDHASTTFWRLVHPDDRERIRRIAGDAITRRCEFNAEYRFFRHGDHALRWTLVRGKVFHDQAGHPARMLGVNIDITETKQAELALHESQALYGSLVEQMSAGVFRKDAEGRYVFANSRYWEMTNTAPENILGKLPQEVTAMRSTPLADSIRHHERIMQTGQQIEVDEEHPDGQGGIRHVHAVKSPVRDASGKIVGSQGILFDVTKSKLAEVALRESEARLSTIFRQSPIGIVISRTTDGKILEANDAFATIHGYTREEIIGRNSTELKMWAEPTQREEMLKRLHGGVDCKNLEIKTRRKSGELGDSLISVELVDLGGEKCTLGLVRDITEIKKKEEANRRLATAVEQAVEDIIITDAKGTILYVNPAFEKLTGYTHAEVIGENPRFLKSGKHDAEYYRKMWNVLTHGEVWSGRIINKKKDGTLFELESTISPIRDDAGHIVNYVGVRRDVTREAALEAQLRQSQKMDAIGKLAGGVAHDFNNLLTVIRGNVSLLQLQESLPVENATCLTEIAKAAERAASLTRQLLLFGRQQELQTKDLDLNEVVSNITKMLQRVLGEHIQIQLKFATQTLPIHADLGMMDQILLNLAVNSRDAMPDGGQLTIETAFVIFDEAAVADSPQARPGSFACLSVSDNGAGIAPEVLPRIFDPFFTTKAVGKGTGLGLATVFGVVQQHHGWITVQSEMGSGTTFRVYLPLRTISSTEEAAPTETAPTRGGWEGILLVEDEAPVRKLVQKLLSRLGYRVFEASNGPTALEVWRQHKDEIKLMLTDMVMPDGINGTNLAEHLCCEAPGLKVIYMSGYNPEPNDGHRPLQEGVNFLVKPFEADKLTRTVRAMLDAGKNSAGF